MSVNLEKILCPIDNPILPFPAKYMKIASGEDMVIRQVSRAEIPNILCFIGALIHVELVTGLNISNDGRNVACICL